MASCQNRTLDRYYSTDYLSIDKRYSNTCLSIRFVAGHGPRVLVDNDRSKLYLFVEAVNGIGRAQILYERHIQVRIIISVKI